MLGEETTGTESETVSWQRVNAEGKPSITVAICAYTLDRWDDLVAAVTSAVEQSQPPAEVVLVIDYNDELLRRSRERWSSADPSGPSIIIVPNAEQRGLSGARNTAVARASGEIVAFLDDDAAAEPQWLEILTAPYRDQSVVASGGSATPVLRASRPAWWPLEFDWVIGCSYIGLPTRMSDVRNVIGCNMSMRRKELVEVGGFSTDIGRVGTRALGCEETDLCIRLIASTHRRIVYVPEASVHHAVPGSRLNAHYFASRCYNEGLSKALVVSRVGSTPGLASERTYAMHTLPSGAIRGLFEGFRGDVAGVGRAVAIVAGLAITTFGFGVGRVRGMLQSRSSARSPRGE
jgi:GT2 family glycosyltransferase